MRVLTPSDTCKGQRPGACSVRLAVDVICCYLGTDCAQSALVISQFLAVYTQRTGASRHLLRAFISIPSSEPQNTDQNKIIRI